MKKSGLFHQSTFLHFILYLFSPPSSSFFTVAENRIITRTAERFNFDHPNIFKMLLAAPKSYSTEKTTPSTQEQIKLTPFFIISPNQK